MLVLSRKVGERIEIGNDITVTVVRVSGGSVRLGITAPREVLVVRPELRKRFVDRRKELPALIEKTFGKNIHIHDNPNRYCTVRFQLGEKWYGALLYDCDGKTTLSVSYCRWGMDSQVVLSTYQCDKLKDLLMEHLPDDTPQPPAPETVVGEVG